MTPVMFIFVVGIGVALIRRRLVAVPGDPTRGRDAPARLLGWAVGLLAASREPWGQAMIGELDRLDGRARRWRFALGCTGAAVVLPPWGPATAALGPLVALAAGAGALASYTHVHYHLGTDGWTWAGAVLLVVLLAGYVLAASVLLRRPGVAGPGLIGGLIVAAAWMAVSGITFSRWLNSLGYDPWLLVLAPVVVGVGGTLWGGSAAAGRRAARLAALSAGLGVYLYGVLAVAVLGAAGDPIDDGWTVASVISDRLDNQAVFYLMALPLMTATLGWAAAAATARLRPARAIAPPAPTLSPRATKPLPPTGEPTHPAGEAPSVPDHPRPRDGRPNTVPAMATRRGRTRYALLLAAAVVVAALLVLLTLLSPHSG